MNDTTSQGLAVVTGASSGIGLELARCCADHGYDLLIAADEARIEDVAAELRQSGVRAEPVLADLSEDEGIDMLMDAVGGRPVEVLIANAGHGLGHAFLDQNWDEARHVIDTNVTGTVQLIHRIGNMMRTRSRGRILLTGSIAGFIPGSFQAVYNASKAFVDSFSQALRNELKDSGITVTCLMPGATDTQFFERADLMDTEIGQGKKDDPADVARLGFEAMQKGEAQVIVGLKNKLQVAASHVVPTEMLAEQHRKKTEPGSGEKAPETSDEPSKRQQAPGTDTSARRAGAASVAASARGEDALSVLRAQHREVESLFSRFEKLDHEGSRGSKEEVVRTACSKLTVHTQIEEEVFYPAARGVEAARTLLNEAEVEHDAAKDLIASLDAMDARDDMFDATFTVLCEYVKHHVREEEGELFPVLERSELDLDRLGRELTARSASLAAVAEPA